MQGDRVILSLPSNKKSNPKHSPMPHRIRRVGWPESVDKGKSLPLADGRSIQDGEDQNVRQRNPIAKWSANLKVKSISINVGLALAPDGKTEVLEIQRFDIANVRRF